MTSEELVEKAARTLWESGTYSEERVPWDFLGQRLEELGEPDVREEYRKLARAVVALVIEEAAREVDAYRVEYGGYWPALEKVAARIRALAPTEGEMG